MIIMSYFGVVVAVVVGWLVLRAVWRKWVRPALRRQMRSVRTSVVEGELEAADRLDDNECCVCLVEPKVFRVAVTCGHSYCADCIFNIYHKREQQQLDCPYCRAPIVTIFKAFPDTHPADKIELIREQIREYNGRFGDDRSIKRTIVELPFVVARVVDHCFSYGFLLYFLKNTLFLKVAVAVIFYFMLPVDVLPASSFGLLGYVDNFAVLLTAALFTLGKVGLNFLRQRQCVQ